MAWVHADDILLNYPGIEENEDGNVSLLKVAALPNPAHTMVYFSFIMTPGTAYKISVFDVLGRHVQTFDGIAQRDRETISWDCRDIHGRRVDKGIYLYRFESGSLDQQGKLIIQ